MAGRDGEVRVLSNALLAGLPAAVKQAVRDERVRIAFELEADWKDAVPVDTGTYRRSIHTEADATPSTSVVGTNLTNPPYPQYLEYGTGRMAARPSARPSAERARRKIPGRIAAAIRGATS